MRVDVKAILAQKKIKLWERLLCDVNYADMGVAQAVWLVAGNNNRSELLEISEREKTAVLERVASSSNPRRPLLAADVPNHCPLSRRFGVVQGQKVRCVDEYTRSSVNQNRCKLRNHQNPILWTPRHHQG